MKSKKKETKTNLKFFKRFLHMVEKFGVLFCSPFRYFSQFTWQSRAKLCFYFIQFNSIWRWGMEISIALNITRGSLLYLKQIHWENWNEMLWNFDEVVDKAHSAINSWLLHDSQSISLLVCSVSKFKQSPMFLQSVTEKL